MKNTFTTSDLVGAIYDFAASLTTNPEPIMAGSGHDAAPMAERVKEWTGKRGLSVVDANVLDWNVQEAKTA